MLLGYPSTGPEIRADYDPLWPIVWAEHLGCLVSPDFLRSLWGAWPPERFSRASDLSLAPTFGETSSHFC